MIAEGGGAVVQFGQSEFGSFIEPVRTPYGSIQSGYYPLGDGTQLLVSPYMSGDQFARFYLQRTPPKCSDVRVTTARPRPDLTARLLQVVQKSGIQLGSQVQMSEILFTCSSSNQILNGSYVAATTVVPTATSRSGMGGAIWSVVYFGGYLGTPELAADAAKISDNALASLTINPQWLQQRNAVAQRAVIEDKIRSQQFQAQVLAQIAKTQQDISNTITQGYWQRSKVYDEISRKRENAILGTVDVVNPASGDRFKLENSSNYYWMNDQGDKAGTLTHTAPGTGWQELLALP
jgi:hypothetical protein